MGRRGANGGSRPAEAAPIPFKSGKNLDGAKLFISFFYRRYYCLTATTRAAAASKRRGNDPRQIGSGCCRLQDRKYLERSCGIPDSRENFMLVCRAAGSALPPRLDPNEI